MFERECSGYGGFSRKADDASQCVSHKEFEQKIVSSMNKRFMWTINHCFDKSEKMYMKTRCALIILNRVSPAFPNTYQVANSIQTTLQTLVDAKEEIN